MRWMLAALILPLAVAAQEPGWFTSTVGEPDPEVVPAPFTPVERAGSATGASFGVVGRTITCEGQPLPTRLISAGTDLLAGPIGLSAATAAGPVPLAWEAPALGDRTPSEAGWSGQAAGDGWTAQVAATIAYDGLLTTTLTLTPPAGGAELTDLRLTIPFAPGQATLYSWWPGKWGTAANSGAVGPEGLSVPFKPLLWLGNEERGLSFCAESDEGWVPPADGQVYRFDASGLLTVHLIAAPTRLTGPWQTQFLLHPTPVKPFPADPHARRINHGAQYGLETRPWWGRSGKVVYDAGPLLDPARGTLELWISPGFDPDPTLDAAGQATRGSLNRDLVTIRLANGDTAGFYWNIDDRGMRFYVRQGNEVAVVVGHRNEWQTGQVYPIALTWGDAIRIYAGGELLAEKPFEGLFGRPSEATGATLTLGGETATFGVHAWRLERQARTSFAPGPPTPGADTTLCEVGEAVGTGGVRTGGTTAPGAFGPALFFYEPGRSGTLLDGLYENGVRTLIFHEQWTDLQNYPVTTHGDALRSLSEAIHERGMRLAVYFGYELSDLAPEWEAWHEQCLVAPRQGGYHRQPEQTAYIVCYRSVWQNFLLAGMDRAVEEYGLDGVYLDGTIEPFGCTNEAHGCGYVGADGKRHPTYPILAVRRLMQRMYTLLAARRADPIIDAHQSLCMMSPTLSWCTGYWDGEQLTSQRIPDRPPLDYLPLATFRAEFMGRQWGVPAQFLNYAGRPFEPDQVLAFCLLHDVLPRGSGMNRLQELVTPVWQAFDRLPRREAEFVGYWSPDHRIAVTGEGVHVSYYTVHNARALVVVSNLGPASVEAVLRPADDWLPGMLLLADALGGEAPRLEGRAIHVPLAPLECRLLEVNAAP